MIRKALEKCPTCGNDTVHIIISDSSGLEIGIDNRIRVCNNCGVYHPNEKQKREVFKK